MMTAVMAMMTVIIIRECIPDHPSGQDPQRRTFRRDRLDGTAVGIIGRRATGAQKGQAQDRQHW